MAAKKDKMIPSEKERKRALKYATPAGTGRMWVTMGIAFIIFGIILLLIPIGLVISEASAQRYDPESIHTKTILSKRARILPNTNSATLISITRRKSMRWASISCF